MTEIKICGLTRPEDVAAACELGAAMVGFNFVAESPRRLTLQRAREIAAEAPANVVRAGVFANESRDEIALAAREVALQVVQLHRAVRAEDLSSFGAEVVPAVAVEAGRDGLPEAEILARCRAILWDSSTGRGRSPDWSALERVGPVTVPVFVAGGLDPENVGEIIRRLRPDGVDVASGVESTPGVKDRRKLERFFAAVREADRA